MEYTPSRQRAKYIIKNVIKFKQPQSEIELTEFHKSAHPSGYEQHRPDRAPLQRICDDKSKREKKQDVIQDLHPQRNIFPEYPGFIGPERLQLIQTLRSRFPEGQRKTTIAPSSTARLMRAAGCLKRLRNRTLSQCMKKMYSTTKTAINMSSSLY